MSHLTRKLAAVAVLALMVLTVTSVALAQETSTEGEPIVFTVGVTSDMVSPNPFKACCGSEYEMLFMAYDQLYNFSQPTLEATDGLAIWPPDVSEDGKTYTMKIREGAKWSDGKPVTARDVAFTFNFINDNNMAAFNNYLGVPESFEAVDDTTFVWTMKTATPVGPNTPPWVPIVPEHIWSKFDGKSAREIKEFRNVPAVSSGPFVLQEWKEGEFWRLTANKEYWGGAPILDEVIFKIYSDQESLKLALESGEVDFAEALEPNIFNSLKGNPDIETHVASQSYLDNLAFNFLGTANPALKDQKVRTAIHHSIDKQAIVDRVMLGNGTPGDSMVMPIYSKWYEGFNGTDLEVKHDPEAAKKLLDEAGWVDNGSGVREKDGKPLELEVLAISDSTYSVPEAELIVGWMKDIGIDAKIKIVSENKAYDLWYDQDFDMYVWGWGGDPDPDFILSIFTRAQCDAYGGVWSDTCWDDPAYDKMYEEQGTEVNEEARIAKVREMQEYLYTKAPEIVLAYESDLQAWRKDKWEGFQYQPEPNGSVLFSFGPYSYQTIRPVGTAAAADGDSATGTDSGGIPPAVWIAIGVGVVVIVIAVAMMRRGKSSEDTE